MKRLEISTGVCILVCLLATACQSETIPAVSQPNGALELRDVQVSADTRALGATAITEIGVYVTTKGHAVLNAAVPQLIYKYQSGTWLSDNAPEITETNEVDANPVYAFYPSTLTVTNSATGSHTVPVRIEADNFTLGKQTDYLYATAAPVAVYAAKRAVTFTMWHALAKVSFRVVKSTNVTEALVLKKVELLSGTNRLQGGNNGTMNLTNGVLNGLAATNSIVLEGSAVLAALQSQPNVSALVAPMTAKESRLSFRLTVEVTETNGTVISRSFDTATVSEVQWQAGKHYTYAITVDKMGGSLTNVLIDEWKNDANQNTGIGI